MDIRKKILLMNQGAAEFNVKTNLAPLYWYDMSNVATLFQNTARTTPITADGQAIRGITDLSGLGNHATANSVPYKVNIQNGLSVARIAGVADKYISTAVNTIGTGDFYLVIGFSWTGGSGNRSILAFQHSLLPGQLFCDASNNFTTYDTNYRTFNATVVTGNNIIEFYREGGVFKLRHNSVLDAATYTSSVSIAAGPSRIGMISSMSTLPGDVWEVALCQTVPSAANRDAMYQYLVAKWNPF